MAFFAFGFAFAYGGTHGEIIPQDMHSDHNHTFIGTENFFLIDYENYAFWFFQYVFAATSTTIVAGTLAERSQMVAYFLYSIVLSGFVFPIIAHAVWCIEGFLNAFKGNRLFDCGMLDIAGAGVVHVTGGFTALIASKILGPRMDRFRDEEDHLLPTPQRIQGHSVSLQVIGTFLLWFGWYGFNVGSVHFTSSQNYDRVASLAVVNTTLGAAAGSIVSLAASAYMTQRKTGEVHFDIGRALNGCLAGLVSVTGGCTVMEPWAALLTGSLSGLWYLLGSDLLIRLEIDDAVDAIPVHLFNGIWGVIAVGLFAAPDRMEDILQQSEHVGWVYSWGRDSGDARLLGANIVGLLCIIGFVFITMFPFFVILQYLGWFRADPLEEIIGLDIRHRGTLAQEGNHREETSTLNRKRLLHHGVTSGAALHRSCPNHYRIPAYDTEHGVLIDKVLSTRNSETVATTDSPTL